MKSMTGYGRAGGNFDNFEITVELKSVNNRFFECTTKIPRTLNFLEDTIKKTVKDYISRGKIDVNVSLMRIKGSGSKVIINEDLVGEYLTEIKKVSKRFGIKNKFGTADIFRIPDAFIVTSDTLDEEGLSKAVTGILTNALNNYDEMRTGEGERLKTDIAARLDKIYSLSEIIEKENAETVKAYTEKLYEKLRTLLEDRNIDDGRVLQEAAMFSDKVCVNEEAVRLRSHVVQFKELMEENEPVGKKLDFLTQELNREANTTGSKCQDSDITKMVIELKSEIEKIREQIQNIE